MPLIDQLFSHHGLEYLLAGGAFFLLILIFSILKDRRRY